MSFPQFFFFLFFLPTRCVFSKLVIRCTFFSSSPELTSGSDLVVHEKADLWRVLSPAIVMPPPHTPSPSGRIGDDKVEEEVAWSVTRAQDPGKIRHVTFLPSRCEQLITL